MLYDLKFVILSFMQVAQKARFILKNSTCHSKGILRGNVALPRFPLKSQEGHLGMLPKTGLILPRIL